MKSFETPPQFNTENQLEKIEQPSQPEVSPKPEALKTNIEDSSSEQIEQEQVLPEEGTEQWAKELPSETFGTEEERKNNFEKLLIELSKEKTKHGISAEEFEKRLKEAEEYTESMPLFHNTSLKGAIGIFNLGKIASLHTLRKEKGLLRTLFQSNTLAMDKRAGLHKMVFVSPISIRNYGDVTLEVDGKILDRPDCVVTYEDIIKTLERVCPPGKVDTIFEYAREYFAMPQVLKEYKSQVISGINFRNFLSHYIAIYGIPEKYQECWGEDFRSGTINSSNAGVHDALSPHVKKMIIPEIKVRNEISFKNIKGVVVKNQAHSDLLINNGVPRDLIKIVGLERGK